MSPQWKISWSSLYGRGFGRRYWIVSVRTPWGMGQITASLWSTLFGIDVRRGVDGARSVWVGCWLALVSATFERWSDRSEEAP